jgi:uncharacterized membrane protein YjfL (UPF0719 family)
VLLAQVTVDDAVATVGYAVVGAVMLAVGCGVLDLVTPGSFLERIRRDRSHNAGVLAVANLAAVGTIVAVAGATSADDTLGEGLASLVVYGGLGVALQAVFLLLIGRALRHEMDELLRSPTHDPMAVTMAAASVALGVVSAVAVS